MSFFQEIAVGSVARLGTYCFTADEITRFAAQFDPQPFHLDADKARETLFGGLCASGWHSAAVFMKLNVAYARQIAVQRASEGLDVPEFGPSPGIRNLRWLRPVFAGDTLEYRSTVTGKRVSTKRSEWGVIDTLVEAENQDGVLALSFEASVFLRV